jgi:hypothetical protein
MLQEVYGCTLQLNKFGMVRGQLQHSCKIAWLTDRSAILQEGRQMIQ